MKNFHGVYVFDLFYVEELNERAFNDFDTSEFREGFLLG